MLRLPAILSILVLVAPAGCTMTRHQTVIIRSEPAGAAVSRSDDGSWLQLGTTPLEIRQAYTVTTSRDGSTYGLPVVGLGGILMLTGGGFLLMGEEMIGVKGAIGTLAGGAVTALIGWLMLALMTDEEATTKTYSLSLDGFEERRFTLRAPGDAVASFSLRPLRNESAVARDKPVVAVFDVSDPGGWLGGELIEALSATLAAALVESGAFHLVPREQVRQRIREAKGESFQPAYDEKLQIELGKALSAQRTLVTQVIRVGQGCALSATFFDLKTEIAGKGTLVESGCAPEDLLAALHQVVARLVEQEAMPGAR